MQWTQPKAAQTRQARTRLGDHRTLPSDHKVPHSGAPRCPAVKAHLEVEVEFGSERLTMLILPGVDALLLCWNFLTQVSAEKRCCHEIIIPARNRHNIKLEEKFSRKRTSSNF